MRILGTQYLIQHICGQSHETVVGRNFSVNTIRSSSALIAMGSNPDKS